MAVTIFFHGIGFFGNNVVGFVYAKKNSDELKISYVNYWGKRVDVDTSFSDVTCIESKSFIRSPLFNILQLKSLNKSLKLCAEGNIVDDNKYNKLCGIGF